MRIIYKQHWVWALACLLGVVGCTAGRQLGQVAHPRPSLTGQGEFGLKVWDESYLGEPAQGQFDWQVATQGTRRIVEVTGSGLQGLKAAYLSIYYDPASYHPVRVEFVTLLGEDGDLLKLHQVIRPGELQIGQVLIRPHSKTGLSGAAVLLRVTFEPGRAEPAPTKSISAQQNGGAAVKWLRSVEPTLRWTFGGIGDYDQNGEVNLADLTPIVLNYGDTGPFDPLSLGHVVDGDGNGEINLADITPIVLHFGEVTTGYNVFLRRIGESAPASHRASFAADPLATLQKVDRLEQDGVFLMNFNPLDFSGQVYDGELVSVDISSAGIYSVVLGGEYVLVEIAPQTTDPGDRPSTIVGGDPAAMPHLEWETPMPGSGTYADPFRLAGSTNYSFRLLNASAQDISANSSFNSMGQPQQSNLFEPTIFGQVVPRTGDWPWTLELGDLASLADDKPTRMLASFAPLKPAELTAHNAWLVYDPVNSGVDYPLADFSISPNPAPANWPIRLDASVSIIPGSSVTDYSWDIEELGAGDIRAESVIDTDTALSVLWLSNEGDHNIRLAVSDVPIAPGGNGKAGIERSCQVIEAPFGSVLPVAVATAVPEIVEPGAQAVMIGSDSIHPGAAQGYRVVDYYWEQTGQDGGGTATFDDPYSAVSSVAFSAEAQGSFSFTLHVLDNVGSRATDTVQVVVETIVLLPVAVFSPSPNPVIVGNEVSFDAAGSFHQDPLRSIVEYRWDFDGDGTDDQTTSLAATAHTYVETGSFMVRLTVVDDDIPAQFAVQSKLIQVDPVPNDPPVAVLVIGSSPTRVNRQVTLDASGSSDSDGSIVLYEFDVDGDGSYEYSGLDSIIQHTYTAPFDLWATVRVTDDDGENRITSAPMQVLPAGSWHTMVVDDGGGTNDVGRNAHLALVGGFPAIAYYDATAQDLKYARAKNARGLDWRNGVVVAASPGVDDGLYPVLFQLGNNPPVIAFHDATNAELEIVPATDSVGLDWGTATVIDGVLYSAGQGLSGLSSADREALAYYDTSNNRLLFMRATNEAGTSWDSPVEVAQAVGAVDPAALTSMSLNLSSFPCITAQLDAAASLHVANILDGSAWEATVVINAAAGPSAQCGFLPPVAYGVYYDTGAAELRVEIATFADGSDWGEQPSRVGSLVDAGELVLLGPSQTQGLIYDSNYKYFLCVGSPTAGLLAFTTEDSQGANWDAAVPIDSGAGAGAGRWCDRGG